jgi:hypothetical protein
MIRLGMRGNEIHLSGPSSGRVTGWIENSFDNPLYP